MLIHKYITCTVSKKCNTESAIVGIIYRYWSLNCIILML